MTLSDVSAKTLGATVTWRTFLSLLDQCGEVHVVFHRFDFAATDPKDRVLAGAMKIPKEAARDRAEWAIRQHGDKEGVNVSSAGSTLFFGAS